MPAFFLVLELRRTDFSCCNRIEPSHKSAPDRLGNYLSPKGGKKKTGGEESTNNQLTIIIIP